VHRETSNGKRRRGSEQRAPQVQGEEAPRKYTGHSKASRRHLTNQGILLGGRSKCTSPRLEGADRPGLVRFVLRDPGTINWFCFGRFLRRGSALNRAGAEANNCISLTDFLNVASLDHPSRC
jgi:hypothetical protein